MAPWCQIDTSSGSLAVVLDAFNCFDAEMYADELALEEPVEFREDQRSKAFFFYLKYHADTDQSTWASGFFATCLQV